MVTVEVHEKLCRLVNASRQGADDTTPISLVQEMIDKIPEEIWKDTSATILDPAAGTGTFLVAAYWKMIEAGDNHENIISNRLFACEINLVYLKIIKDKLGLKNIYNKDFLELNLDMKFDVVIGNPPYQHPDKLQVKLWPPFITKGLDMVSSNGWFSMVYPAVWTNRPFGQKWKKVVERIKELEVVTIKVDENKTWFNVGETTAYVLVRNSPFNNKHTLVESVSGKVENIIYSGQKLLQSKEDLMVEDIVSKAMKILVKDGKLPIFEDIDHNSKKEDLLEQGILSTDKKDGMLPIWYTASQKYYTDSSRINKSWRVLLNMSGYFYQNGTSKYQRVVKEEGCTSGMKSVLVTSEKEGYNVLSYTSSKLYRFLNDSQKTSGFNTFMIKLPYLDSSVEWTDYKLYKYFNLTQEEINLIESTIA